ncbi:MAG: cupredoxin domain-containing protein [Actinomycetota bacterium]
MNSEVSAQGTRERFWLPLAIPVGALAFIALIAFSMSRILLNVPPKIATAVALMAAFNILMVCTLAALRSDFRKTQFAFMGAVALVPVVFGGLVAQGVVAVTGEPEGHESESEVVAVAASNIAFDKTELHIPAGKPFDLKFNNQEPVPHNVAILEAQGSAEALFRKPSFSGPKAIDWKVPAIPAGEYYFQCDVHPNMSGKVTSE